MSLRMPRPPKNENHPLTRLRRILSEEGIEVTREIFSERTGIPVSSLKAIEVGTYKLSPLLAKKIAATTGVHPWSLLNDTNPLRDGLGRRYTAQSYRQFQLLNELGPIQKMADAHALCLRLIALLRDVSDKRYNQLFMRLYLETQEILREFKVLSAAEQFNLTNLTLVENPPSECRLRKDYPFLWEQEAHKLLNFSRFFEEDLDKMVVDPKIKKRLAKG